MARDVPGGVGRPRPRPGRVPVHRNRDLPSFIFDEPHVGHDGVRAYWTGATADQSDIEVILGTPMDDGEHVAVEWWTQMDVDGEPMTLVGTLLLTFAPDGRCRRLREYYHHIPQRKAPPPGWGSWD